MKWFDKLSSDLFPFVFPFRIAGPINYFRTKYFVAGRYSNVCQLLPVQSFCPDWGGCSCLCKKLYKGLLAISHHSYLPRLARLLFFLQTHMKVCQHLPFRFFGKGTHLRGPKRASIRLRSSLRRACRFTTPASSSSVVGWTDSWLALQ